MQSRGRVTAAEVARELEVSVATARRDLEALSTAGIPVYPQAGRGGGWSLVGGARTDLSGLSEGEARALFLLLGPAAGSAEAKGALRKLVQALPRTFRADAVAAAEATVVDDRRWGEQDRDRPPMVAELQTAVIRRRKVRVSYANHAGKRSEWLLDPLGLVDKNATWYLVAGSDRGRRTFRVDRILSMRSTDEIARRPDDFTLEQAWDEVVGEMEERRSRLWATVIVPGRYAYVLRDQFGRHVEQVGPVDAEQVRVRVGAPTALDIARHLAGWGTMIDVTEPEPVRAELARIGAELSARYR